jgi:hypothetical protein
MTPAEKQVLRKVRRRLKAAFKDCIRSAVVPGNARVWFVPYLAEVLRAYDLLREAQPDGRRVTKTLGHRRRARFIKLLRKSCNRDGKTISRWAATLTNAKRSNISPEDFKKWLNGGGGVSGRAAEEAKQISKTTLAQDN